MLKEYIRKQQKDAVHQLEHFVQSSEAEAIHQLRVCMKKLRAVYRFLSVVHPSKKLTKSYKKKFRLLFAAAGAIREKQLMKQRLTHLNADVLIATSSSFTDADEGMEQFKVHAAHHEEFISSFTHRLLELADKVKEDDLLRYCITLREQLFQNMKLSAQDNWHELRKQIKQLLYSYHWMLPLQQIKLIRVQQMQALNRLQEAIGNWHDLIDFKQWLDEEAFYFSSDKQVLASFKKVWKHLQQEIKKAEEKVKPAFMNIHQRRVYKK
jgi:CHAD domain-containing protein